jgi:signal transduction histidine kinase/ActR/RegA family two-component response regulator
MQTQRMQAKRTRPTRCTGDPRQAALASMLYPALPTDEPARLATLRALDVLDTPADRVLDELAHVASRVCGTPIALVSLVDEARQWFKARVGLAATETCRDVAFCAHAIHGRGLFEIADAHLDPRFADNPLVAGPPHVRFYAGVPLVVDGVALGTLCVIDVVPRALTPDQRDALRALARSVASHLQMRRTERELIAARVQAERLASARARFLATMSHEIRTPMNGVLGALELLADQALDGDAAELAELVHASGTRLMDLLDDVLDLSKLDAGKMELDCRPFDLVAELQAVVALLEPVARRTGVRLGLDEVGSLAPGYVGDPLRLGQIVTNLAGNALKFTAHGEVSIRANAIRDDERGADRLEIDVADTGIGIPPETLAGLFEPFRQADGSTSTRYGGTGLGLAISRELAGLMNGSLTATSKVGVGSRFTLRLSLPRATGESAGPAHRGPAGSAGAAPAGATSPCDVLLVDDEPVNRLIAARLLRRAGYRVAVAVDGADALERTRERRYDLILMDCMMPGVDGLQATRALRDGDGPNRDTPIVALTANVLDAEHAACRQAGMDEVLTKPIRPDVLVAAIARHVSAPRRCPARGTARAPLEPAAPAFAAGERAPG